MGVLKGKQLKKAKKLRKEGMSLINIARHFGISEHFVNCSIVPGYLEKRANDSTKFRVKRGSRRELKDEKESGTTIKRDALKLKAKIPRDTRSFTQTFCGDPLPGRSALDRREKIS